MDELKLIREFRADVPPASSHVREQARAALTARIERGRRRFGLPRRRVLVALAVVVTGLAAGSALGLGDPLLDLFRGKPAPRSVQADFARFFRDRETIIPMFERAARGVIADKAHGVLVIRTRVAPIVLWAAPTRSGTVCFHFQFVDPKTYRVVIPPLDGGCGPFRFPRKILAMAVTSTAHYASPRSPGLTTPVRYAWGVARPGVASVELQLSTGRARRVRVFERFFGIEAPGAVVEQVVAFDRRGAVLGRWRPEKPPPPAREPTAVGRYRKLIQRRAVGRKFTLFVAPASEGPGCTRLTIVPPGDDAAGCALPSIEPIGRLAVGEHVFPGPRFAYMYGPVAGVVKTLELRYEDAASERVEIVEGWVLHVIFGVHTRRGHRVAELVARDAAGRIVAGKQLARPTSN